MVGRRQVELLRVVVASPGDVQAERNALGNVIEELNRDLGVDHEVRIELVRWETDAYPGFHSGGPQGLIDSVLRVEECDLLVGIFWKRFGTPTPDADSGTEHEFRLAYSAWKEHGSPQIMMYFKEQRALLKTKSETDQWGRVLQFKEEFPKEGLWWPYKTYVDFERLVRNHLNAFFRRQLSPSTDSAAQQLEAPAENAFWPSPSPTVVDAAVAPIATGVEAGWQVDERSDEPVLQPGAGER